MDLLLTLVVYVVVLALLGWLISIAPIDSRYKQIVFFFLAAVLVILLIRLLTGGGRFVVV
jgi:VIT1/CCC1 family predicted Fe2+/Mn2+ transporter